MGVVSYYLPQVPVYRATLVAAPSRPKDVMRCNLGRCSSCAAATHYTSESLFRRWWLYLFYICMLCLDR